MEEGRGADLKSGLYVIEFSTGRIKVGRSANVPRRLYAIQNATAPAGVTVVRAEHFPFPEEGLDKREKALLARCWEAASARFAREYFEGLTFEQATEFVTARGKVPNRDLVARQTELSDERAERNAHVINWALDHTEHAPGWCISTVELCSRAAEAFPDVSVNVARAILGSALASDRVRPQGRKWRMEPTNHPAPKDALRCFLNVRFRVDSHVQCPAA